MYKIVYAKTALKDIPKLKSAHLDEKAKALISVIKENPFQNPPPYEKLVGDLNGSYSRRINVQHRLVYDVFEEEQTIKILSLTIPAGSVAKGSTVTVEAQYRDATIESEPSILGTAAIIGVAGAGTAVIVWQGYRIGMELYEKYFQPTPEETAAEQPAPEAPAAAAAS